MNVIVFINEMFNLANEMLDFAFLWGGLFVLLALYPVYFFATNLRKYSDEHRGRELLIQTIILFLIVAGIAIVWISPEIVWQIWFNKPYSIGVNVVTDIQTVKMFTWRELAWLFSSIRWLIFFGVFFALAYLLGHEHGKNRWIASASGHFAVIALGWIVNFWMGVIFISIPMIATYYGALYSLANVILPTSDPEDRAEKKKKFYVLASYAWGTQSPITVVDDHAWKKYDPRITGDITWEFSEFPIPFINKLQRPGLIWTKSHQATTVSGGTKFKRVEAPGVSFIGKLERLDQVFDLRLQLRTREIEVVSKDGIRFIARYFTGFRIDNENWNKETYDFVRRLNPQLRGADKLTQLQGSFPFSYPRVQATLGVTSTKVAENAPLIFWDQWAMNVVEDQTRKAISQINLDEMWRPAEDAKFANAMDIIAGRIKSEAEKTLRAAGLLLVVARVVNFQFLTEKEQNEKLDDISRQQIATWGSEWERKRSKILAEAEAEAERTQHQARANAEGILISSISEGLQKTHEMNPELPRFVILMRFLSALQNDTAQGEDSDDVKKRISELQKTFKEWQENFFPDKEKTT